MAAVAGLILAGGRSSRMGGGDKTALTLGGLSMVQIIADRLRPQVDKIAVSSNSDPASLPSLGLPLLADSIPGFQGPLAGILAGLEWALSIQAERLITVAGDTPFFPTDLATRLTGAPADHIVVAASQRGVHPTFALWPTALASDLRRHLETGGTRKVVAFIERYPHTAVTFDNVALHGGSVDPFFNINTPDDLAEARRLLHDDGKSEMRSD